MRVGVIQSCYVPWRGYFDFVASVDLFVLYDDVTFSRGSWRNRNTLKMGASQRWLTVPVNAHLDTPIDQVTIADTRWVKSHRGLIRESLGPADYFEDARQLWEAAVGDGDGLLSSLNERLLRAVCGYLGIATRIVRSRPYGAVGAKTERLVDLLRKVGADTYLSGSTARAYFDAKLFREAAIRLEWKSYDYEPYPQQAGPFIGTVSVLDLIANCGPASPSHLRSRSPDVITVP